MPGQENAGRFPVKIPGPQGSASGTIHLIKSRLAAADERSGILPMTRLLSVLEHEENFGGERRHGS
jgi:hypothetical protein